MPTLYNTEYFLQDCFNIQLSFLGILITLFTVIFTILLGKIEELKIYSELIKNGTHSLQIIQNEKLLHKFIKGLKKVNQKLLVAFLIAFVLFLIIWVYRFLCLHNKWYLLLIEILFCFEIIFFIFLTIKIIRLYFISTRLD